MVTSYLYGGNREQGDYKGTKEEVKNGERTEGGPTAVAGDWVYL